MALERYPDGITRGGFFQKQVPEHFPEWIERVQLPRERGGTVTHVLCQDRATLEYLADQAVLVFHRLLVTADRPRHPVELILDLDPPRPDPPLVIRAARLVRDLFDELDIVGFVKSTGSRGVHIHVPLDGSDAFDLVRAFAHDLAAELVRRDPTHLTIEHRKDRRGRRLFVDWLRNGYGQHAAAPYTLRALPDAPVAVPLGWEEATGRDFDPRRYRLGNVFRRLGRKRDPWQGIGRRARSIEGAAARLRRDHWS